MPNWFAVHRTHIFQAIQSKINELSKLPVSWLATFMRAIVFICPDRLHIICSIPFVVTSNNFNSFGLFSFYVFFFLVHPPPKRSYDSNRCHSFSLTDFRLSDAPRVSVHLANEEPIPSRLIVRAERENVTIKCRSDANPPADSFKWFKNVSYLCCLPCVQQWKSICAKNSKLKANSVQYGLNAKQQQQR